MLEVEDFSERGDAPALAIIQDNARKKAVRQVVETQEELTRIHDRVTRVSRPFFSLSVLVGFVLLVFHALMSFADYRRVRTE